MEYYSSFEELVNDRFADFFDSLDEWQQIGLWNDYCDDCNLYEDRIYYMEDLDDLFCDCKPLDLLDKLSDNFCSRDKFFKDGIYGLDSFDHISGIIEVSDLQDWFIRNNTCIEDNEDFATYCEDEYDLEENKEDNEN